MADPEAAEIAALQEERRKAEAELVALNARRAVMDSELYGGDRDAAMREVVEEEEEGEEADERVAGLRAKMAGYTAPRSLMDDVPRGEVAAGDAEGSFARAGRIIDREDDYRKRRLNRQLSPARNDAFALVRARGVGAGGAPRDCAGAAVGTGKRPARGERRRESFPREAPARPTCRRRRPAGHCPLLLKPALPFPPLPRREIARRTRR